MINLLMELFFVICCIVLTTVIITSIIYDIILILRAYKNHTTAQYNLPNSIDPVQFASILTFGKNVPFAGIIALLVQWKSKGFITIEQSKNSSNNLIISKVENEQILKENFSVPSQKKEKKHMPNLSIPCFISRATFDDSTDEKDTASPKFEDYRNCGCLPFHQKYLFHTIFSSSNSITIDTLTNDFKKELKCSDFKFYVLKSLNDMNFYDLLYRHSDISKLILFLTAQILCLRFDFQYFFQDEYISSFEKIKDILMFAVLIFSVYCFKFTSCLSNTGKNIYDQCLGFATFLKQIKSEELHHISQQDAIKYDKLFPFAIVLGISRILVSDIDIKISSLCKSSCSHLKMLKDLIFSKGINEQNEQCDISKLQMK